jgi:hypothetical protein
MPRFAQPTDDQLAVHGEDHGDRALERVAEAVGQRVERPRLVVQDFAPEREHAFCGFVSRCTHHNRPSPGASGL